jgi:hypothetical protein
VEAGVEDDEREMAMRKLRRSSELRRLWCRDDAFAASFVTAVRAQLVSSPSRGDADTQAFLDNVVARLVVRPTDLLSLCRMLSDERLSREFMRFYVRHELADHDVLFALVESPAVFRSLPDDPGWMEVAVLLYGSAKLNESDGKELSIAEIAPLGLETEPSTVRSLVGSAFDAGILVEADCARLLTLFPEDAYFRARLADRRRPG